MSDETPAELGAEGVVTGVLDDGTLVISAAGEELRSMIHGVSVPVPVPAGYVEVITRRVPRTGRPLRIRLVPAPPPESPRVQLYYLAWHDKSGPVWRDLAPVLLSEGVVRVAQQQFPERTAYLDAERAARGRGLGVWS